MSVVEVAIGHGGRPGKFRVEVVRSPAGEVAAEVSLDVGMLLAGRAQFEQTLLVSGVAARRVLTAAERTVQETGQALFAALLGSVEVAGRYRASTALAEERGEELRIVLRLDAPDLAALPWEAMYDPGTGGYVCREHQLVRHVPVAAVPPPLAVPLPLRILGVISAPRGLADLGSGQEGEHLARTLAPLAGQGLAELAWAPSATWDGLHEMLLAGPWHVLHFIGHGSFDPDRDEGMLALTRDDGKADLVEASRFASLLRQAQPMPRLVVLNSCSGAATGQADLFSGTAAALARHGVAAVTAMQYSISDTAAVAFARGFYAALAHGRGVDEAVSAGRIAILGTSGQTLEWIIPVMYLRGHDARLFTLPPVRSRIPPSSQAAKATPVNGPPTSGLLRPAHVLRGHTKDVLAVAFSPDGTLLATGGQDKKARLWDVATGQTIRILTNPIGIERWVCGVAFSPDGTLLATASGDGKTRLWDIPTGRIIRTVPPGMYNMFGVAYSPDGTRLATGNGGEGGSGWLWDIATGQVIHKFPDSLQHWLGVTFSPDGAILATASSDMTARLWNVATGRTIRTFTGHTDLVAGVAFSPDGTLLATASYDKTARLWNVATGRIHELVNHTKAVLGVAFNSDGALATASRDKTAVLWT